MTVEDVMAWLDGADGRLLDVFGLWTQGKRDSRWVAGVLVKEGHLALLGVPVGVESEEGTLDRLPNILTVPRGFAPPGVDDPLRDFMATYFDHDDDVTRGMVGDYLDRIAAAYASQPVTPETETP